MHRIVFFIISNYTMLCDIELNEIVLIFNFITVYTMSMRFQRLFESLCMILRPCIFGIFV